jgi:glycosyltransferase involved in cell wall biosynthesis
MTSPSARDDCDVSVIIVNWNNAGDLAECLGCLRRQSWRDFEIIVVDNGSTDQTASIVAPFAACGLVRFISAPHRGPAAARNAGLDQACGRLVLFTGDDMIAPPDLLRTHVEAHQAHPEPEAAIVGDVRWFPTLQVTPLMHWLDHGGSYYHFYDLADGALIDHRYFVTANLSLKRAFVGADRFDQDFRWAAFEDMELGYRLMRRGLRLIFRSIPIFHLHPVTSEDLLRRMEYAGRAARLLERKWPNITGLENIQRPRLHFVLRHRRLSEVLDSCLRWAAEQLGDRTPLAVYRYLIRYARWCGYVSQVE